MWGGGGEGARVGDGSRRSLPRAQRRGARLLPCYRRSALGARQERNAEERRGGRPRPAHHALIARAADAEEGDGPGLSSLFISSSSGGSGETHLSALLGARAGAIRGAPWFVLGVDAVVPAAVLRRAVIPNAARERHLHRPPMVGRSRIAPSVAALPQDDRGSASDSFSSAVTPTSRPIRGNSRVFVRRWRIRVRSAYPMPRRYAASLRHQRDSAAERRLSGSPRAAGSWP